MHSRRVRALVVVVGHACWRRVRKHPDVTFEGVGCRRIGVCRALFQFAASLMLERKGKVPLVVPWFREIARQCVFQFNQRVVAWGKLQSAPLRVHKSR